MRTKRFSGRPAAAARVRTAEDLFDYVPPRARARLQALWDRWPALTDEPIRIRFRPSLWARRGKLRSRAPGVEVHAASFLRRRVIVLEAALLGQPAEMARILAHELSHFIWFRLANAVRGGWEQLLRQEWEAGARGELGFSSQGRKQALRSHDAEQRTRRWREYVCESFCDTAAYWALRQRHAEFSLEQPWRKKRAAWFNRLVRSDAMLARQQRRGGRRAMVFLAQAPHPPIIEA